MLFADVVHSTHGAGWSVHSRSLPTAVGVSVLAARCREWTGDDDGGVRGAGGVEDHAVRACLAALGVQEEGKRLVDVAS